MTGRVATAGQPGGGRGTFRDWRTELCARTQCCRRCSIMLRRDIELRSPSRMPYRPRWIRWLTAWLLLAVLPSAAEEVRPPPPASTSLVSLGLATFAVLN